MNFAEAASSRKWPSVASTAPWPPPRSPLAHGGVAGLLGLPVHVSGNSPNVSRVMVCPVVAAFRLPFGGHFFLFFQPCWAYRSRGSLSPCWVFRAAFRVYYCPRVINSRCKNAIFTVLSSVFISLEIRFIKPYIYLCIRHSPLAGGFV